jgi:alpha-tubulin suppressor-like RCC1 family protein
MLNTVVWRSAFAALFLTLVSLGPASGCAPQHEGEAVVEVSAQALAADDVARVTVQVSGPGISPDIVSNLVHTGGQWGGTIRRIPAGSDRTFTATAYDASGAEVSTGQATGITISPSSTAAVVIPLDVGPPCAPDAPPVIDQTCQSTDTVAPGGAVSLMVAAHDPEGTAISFAWSASGGTLGVPVSGTSQSEVSWTAPMTGGPFTVTVVVQDAQGSQATHDFSVTVTGTACLARVAAGGSHSLLVKADGTLWATGSNVWGQLGDGTTTQRRSFVQVLDSVSYVAAGPVHTMALKADGTLWATGWNTFGQLGDGTTTERHGFIQVLSGVSSVAVGNFHTLALKSDGTLWATGLNNTGQLGDGTTTNRHGFVQVLTEVAAIAAGGSHSMAVKRDGTLWATGHDFWGQLGDGNTPGGGRLAFVQVLSNVTSVAAGESHTLAVKTDGTLWATGYNRFGQLGIGMLGNRDHFVQVLTGVSSAAAFSYHSLALKTDGSLWAAGRNNHGQLGDGTMLNRFSFVQVLTGVMAAATGTSHTLALKADGTLWATGLNASGQLGDGTTNDRHDFGPVPVP